MPIYTYRREDGTTFEVRQSFNDDPLEFDPETGQRVQRIVQGVGVIFKGSGFYITDNNGSKRNLTTPTANGNGHGENGHSNGTSAEAPKTEKADAKSAAD